MFKEEWGEGDTWLFLVSVVGPELAAAGWLSVLGGLDGVVLSPAGWCETAGEKVLVVIEASAGDSIRGGRSWESSWTVDVSSSMAPRQYSGHEVSRAARWPRILLAATTCLERIRNRIGRKCNQIAYLKALSRGTCFSKAA